MIFKELEAKLLKLTPAEKAKIINILSQSLANHWEGIEKTPEICSGKACIINTRIPVWGLVHARNLGYSETDILSNYPSLSATDLANAWAYAEAFNEEIAQDIKENEEAE
ncbi:hypothetical protein VF14_14855 [Nostoc linckia z18]|jgi:uncharacterized protein (DUF433 family)|uniref:DUF433 domain-containing protein n=2 Tax=Nostoc linckia TaxID=92942 RepID=A0A9Q5ZAH8_NOSLI|nr:MULTISPECIES: DUF433 domain-containing protein [Nostoc]PHK39808.1 hypothetical protein VF12_12760 [Nostoc linckia z15]PHK46576.1 hypothetical protein VF13_10280 [Nostoc linckia z16]MBC1237150.1 DUF433 domain-containing protein [Nostoc sp. 2RC]PHJ60438.1 hypothetical protein VF02_22290 [Nostoc linckia z1]PHJ63983.1 hypothetical protein VF05_23260 [Nostoc linckia z3]